MWRPAPPAPRCRAAPPAWAALRPTRPAARPPTVAAPAPQPPRRPRPPGIPPREAAVAQGRRAAASRAALARRREEEAQQRRRPGRPGRRGILGPCLALRAQQLWRAGQAGAGVAHRPRLPDLAQAGEPAHADLVAAAARFCQPLQLAYAQPLGRVVVRLLLPVPVATRQTPPTQPPASRSASARTARHPMKQTGPRRRLRNGPPPGSSSTRVAESAFIKL
jgi:hypothetical protein